MENVKVYSQSFKILIVLGIVSSVIFLPLGILFFFMAYCVYKQDNLTDEQKQKYAYKQEQNSLTDELTNELTDEQKTEFANKLVEYNTGNGLGFDCWADTRIAKKWIECQSDFTKPMLEIYTNNREFLDEHGSLFREIHLTKRQLDKYDSLKLLGLARLTENRLEDIKDKVNKIKELYDSFSEEDKAKALNIELEVLNLIINDAEKRAKNITIDYGNTLLNAETQRGLFKAQYMASILTDYKNVYGQALSCFNLKHITHIPELDEIETKIKFIEDNRPQLELITTGMKVVESLNNKMLDVFKKYDRVRTPFGQIPQVYVDFQRKFIVLGIEELSNEFKKIIDKQECTKEWLDSIESVQTRYYNALKEIEIDVKVLERCGIFA